MQRKMLMKWDLKQQEDLKGLKKEIKREILMRRDLKQQ